MKRILHMISLRNACNSVVVTNRLSIYVPRDPVNDGMLNGCNRCPERFKNYWDVPAVYAKVLLESAPNPETRANIALSGHADIIQEVPAASVDRINSFRVSRVQPLMVPRHIMLMVNAGKPPFETAALRRALSLTIDRRGIAAAVPGDADLAATQSPVLPQWHFPELEPFTFNIEEANRILDKAGLLRGHDGTRYGGLIRTFPQRAYLPVIAEILRNQRALIGYEMTIAVGDMPSDRLPGDKPRMRA